MSNPIFSIFIIILSLGFSFFFVKPEFDNMQQRRTHLTTLEDTLNSAAEIQTLVEQTQKTLDSVDPNELKRFEVFLPKTTDSLRLANNIQRIGFSHGVVIGQIKVDEPLKTTEANARQIAGGGVTGVAAGVRAATGAQKYATTKTTFSFTSNEDNFRAFLADIEKSLGVMNITSLTFTPIEPSSEAKKAAAPTSKLVAAVVAKPTVPLYQYAFAIETYSLN